MTRAIRTHRRGTALVAVLAALTVAMLVATAAATLGRTLQDEARAALATLRARSAAEGALATVLATWPATWTTLVAGTSDTRDVTSAAGTATVRALRLDASRYLLSADGASAALPGPIGPAIRRVGVFAQLDNVRFDPTAALVTAGPVTLSNDIDVRGADAAPPTWTDCDPPPDAGAGAAIAASSVKASSSARVAGAVLTDPNAWTPPTPERFGDVDRDALAARADLVLSPGGSYTPIPRVAAGGTACLRDRTSWGEPWRSGTAVSRCMGEYPVIHVRGPGTTLLFGPARFQGTLIVDGSLEVNGRVDVAGLIIVNGTLQARNGALVVDGAVVIRGSSTVLGAASRIRRSRCALERAAAAASRPGPLARRAWVDLVR